MIGMFAAQMAIKRQLDLSPCQRIEKFLVRIQIARVEELIRLIHEPILSRTGPA